MTRQKLKKKKKKKTYWLKKIEDIFQKTTNFSNKEDVQLEEDPEIDYINNSWLEEHGHDVGTSSPQAYVAGSTVKNPQ